MSGEYAEFDKTFVCGFCGFRGGTQLEMNNRLRELNTKLNIVELQIYEINERVNNL